MNDFNKILVQLDIEIDEIDLYGYDIIETSLSMQSTECLFHTILQWNKRINFAIANISVKLLFLWNLESYIHLRFLPRL